MREWENKRMREGVKEWTMGKRMQEWGWERVVERMIERMREKESFSVLMEVEVAIVEIN